MTQRYPWQESQWQSLLNRRQQARLPHALLLTGPNGLGKLAFAQHLARSLLCREPSETGDACGQCRSCAQFEAQSHPDLMQLMPAEPGKSITVDQARGVGEFLSVSSHYEGMKLVIIAPAEQMNINAANSLLKTLEEPNAGRLLLLVSDRPSALLPTIRSRCQQVGFSNPSLEQAQAYLQQHLGEEADVRLLLALSNNAPLRALELHQSDGIALRSQLFEEFEAMLRGQQSGMAIAAHWSKAQSPASLFGQLQSWLMDMLRLKASGDPPWLNNPDLRPRLQKIANGLNWEVLVQQLQQVNKANRPGIFSSNLQLWLEDWLIVMTNGYQA